MRKLIFFVCLLAAAPALAQNVRISFPFPSITSSYATPFLIANTPPSSPIPHICAYPANATPCTNYVTTYNSSGVACANGSQDTPDPQPSACQAAGDAEGNIGFWIPPGKYDYTVCVGSNCYGPYTFTAALADLNGVCTMVAGVCPAVTFASAFTNTPTCVLTWSGTGTLTGLVKSLRSTTGLQPTSTINTDTAEIDWKCQGNPN
jgi:hypothetical protein